MTSFVRAAIGRASGVLGPRLRRPPVLLLLPAAVVAAAMLLPIVYLAIRASGAGAESWDLLWEGRTLAILGRTSLLAVTVTGASLLIAVPLAWLTERTDLPLRRMWAVLAALPLVIPSYVGGFVVVAALGPRGLLQGVLERTLGIERLPEIYGFPGAALTLTLLSFPYVLLSVQAGLRGLDPATEEASRSLGAGRWATFRRVVLPQLRPAMAAGALMVALYTLRDFGAVSLLRFQSFTNVIYLEYQASLDRTLAAALSLVLVALTVALLALELRSRGRARYYGSGAGAGRKAAPIPLGRWRWPAIAFCTAVVLLALIMPMAVLGYWLVQGLLAGEPLRLVWSAAFNSAYVSGLAVLAAVAAALPVAILAVRFRSKFGAVAERSTYLGFALPGIVIALALAFFSARYARPLYQSLGLLVFAYLVLFLPQAVGVIRATLLQVRPSLEEAARGLGRSPLRVFATVTLPLLRPGVLAGAALVFLTAMKELPATLLLGPTGFKTLATTIWSATSEAFFARAAAPALLLVIAASIPMALLAMRDDRSQSGPDTRPM